MNTNVERGSKVAANEILQMLSLDNYQELLPQLSPKQLGLLCDAKGILTAIIKGNITSGKERLRDNILEVLSEWRNQNDAPNTSRYGTPTAHLCQIIQLMAESTISVEGSRLGATVQHCISKAR